MRIWPGVSPSAENVCELCFSLPTVSRLSVINVDRADVMLFFVCVYFEGTEISLLGLENLLRLLRVMGALPVLNTIIPSDFHPRRRRRETA